MLALGNSQFDLYICNKMVMMMNITYPTPVDGVMRAKADYRISLRGISISFICYGSKRICLKNHSILDALDVLVLC